VFTRFILERIIFHSSNLSAALVVGDAGARAIGFGPIDPVRRLTNRCEPPV
jgi:hypothetical protein